MSPSIFSRFAGPIVLTTGLLWVVAQLLLWAGYDVTDRVATLHDPVYLVGGLAIAALGVWMTRGSFVGAKHAGVLATTAFCVVGAVSAGCSLTGTSGDGPMATETRQVDAFSRIEAGFGIGVTVTIGPAQAVDVHAQANLLPIISTAVEGGTLRIDATKEFSTTEAVEVVIVSPTLDGITLSGGSQGQVTGLEADRLEIVLSGGSALTATGSAANIELTSSGGAEAHLADLSAQTVSLELSGGSTANINASTEVNGSAAGGSRATVRGGGRLNVTVSGGAEIVPE